MTSPCLLHSVFSSLLVVQTIRLLLFRSALTGLTKPTRLPKINNEVKNKCKSELCTKCWPPKWRIVYSNYEHHEVRRVSRTCSENDGPARARSAHGRGGGRGARLIRFLMASSSSRTARAPARQRQWAGARVSRYVPGATTPSRALAAEKARATRGSTADVQKCDRDDAVAA